MGIRKNGCWLIRIRRALKAKGKILQKDRGPRKWTVPKEVIPVTTKKTKELTEKWSEDLNRHFSEDDIQMAKSYMKGCSTSLIIREMKIETTTRYHLIPVRNDLHLKKSTNNKCSRGHGEREPSYTACGNVNWYSRCRK